METIKEDQKFDDHLFVALSIIIGLAITSALESWSLIIKNFANIQIGHQHLFWAVVAFYWAVQYWWGLWKYQDIQWGFSNFLLFLSMSVTIFLLNDLIYPEIVEGKALSLADYYFDIHPWYFGVLSLLILLTIFRSIRVAKRAVKDKVNILYYFSLLLSIIAAISSSPAFHNIGIAISIALIIFVAGRGALKLILPDKE
jgi:hypothetical protein